MRNRDVIVNSAIMTFYEVGFSASTMDLVAQRAGVSRQTVYRTFQDKETLFFAAISELMNRVERNIQATINSFPEDPEDLEKALLEYGTVYAKATLSNDWRTLRHIIDPEVMRFPELWATTREHGPRLYRLALAGHLARLALSKRIDLSDADLAARQFITLMFDPAWQFAQLGTGNVDPKEMSDRLRDNVKLFLRAYPVINPGKSKRKQPAGAVG